MPAEQSLAALQPPTEPDQGASAAPSVAFYAELQGELNRVGCSVGTPDGIWGRKSEQGLARLRQHAPTRLASVEPGPLLLEDLRSLDGRVCPLVCSATEEERNGQCVAKTCAAGQKLSSKGVCYTPKQQTASRPKPKAARKCWTLIDEVICE